MTIKLPIVITLGDPAGIGPEIIAKAFRDAPDTVRGCFVAGDVATLRCAAATLQGDSQVSLPVAEIDTPAAALTAPPRCVPVLQVVPRAEPVALGQVSAAAGKMTGDTKLQAEGRADPVEGKVQNAVGGAKDSLRDKG